METVTVSSKYEVEIPPEARIALNIHPGEQLRVIAYGGRIQLVPIKHPRELRGFLPGLDTSVERESEGYESC